MLRIRYRQTALIFLFGIFAREMRAQIAPPPSYSVTTEDVLGLVNSLFGAISPNNPENKYMTPFMKDKIGWIYAEKAAGRVDITVTSESYTAGKDRSDLMLAAWPGGKPTIIIKGLRLWMLVRVQGKSETWTQMTKNTFALSLVHEGVHLELPPTANHRVTYEEWLREELRTWLKVDIEAVRPLRKLGQPLEKEFLAIDDVLKKCNDRIDCKAFRDLLTSQTNVPK